MSKLNFSPRARADLGEIWDYTVERWGEIQADRYVRLIASVCDDLAAGRRTGTSAEALRAGYLRCRAGSHILFYCCTHGGDIEVIRILHQRMDVDRHL
ncbi:type II toxin-antitoxin system RelE/ParE family toxin [Caenispirillum salinarum]|uniref:type II toxin-antitoxin system RelE/ParE family toxin n=1 Tax=Caenispirillum salinarum TaxID=859058 RepID=UPI000A033FB5